MRLHLTGRNVDITPALRQLLSRKLARLERLLQDSALSAQVVLTRERYRHVTDITLHVRGDHMLSGVGSGGEWTDSMSQAVEKVTQQAQRLKEKWTTRKRRAEGRRAFSAISPEPFAAPSAASPTAAPPQPERVRYPIRRHTLRAALARLDKASDGFVLFRHDETMRLSLVYKRRDGTVALIEPEA